MRARQGRRRPDATRPTASREQSSTPSSSSISELESPARSHQDQEIQCGIRTPNFSSASSTPKTSSPPPSETSTPMGMSRRSSYMAPRVEPLAASLELHTGIIDQTPLILGANEQAELATTPSTLTTPNTTPAIVPRSITPTRLPQLAASHLSDDSGYASDTSGGKPGKESTLSHIDEVLSAFDRTPAPYSMASPSVREKSSPPPSERDKRSQLLEAQTANYLPKPQRRASALPAQGVRPSLYDIAHSYHVFKADNVTPGWGERPQPPHRPQRLRVSTNGYLPSTQSSPAGTHSGASPPRSPAATRDTQYGYFDLPRSNMSSPSASVDSSRPTSPLADFTSMHVGERLRKTCTGSLDVGWDAGNHPTSVRATSAMHVDELSSPTRPPLVGHMMPHIRRSSHSGVPYPVDEALTMPSIEEHQYQPMMKEVSAVPHGHIHTHAPVASQPAASSQRPPPLARLNTRQTAATNIPGANSAISPPAGTSAVPAPFSARPPPTVPLSAVPRPAAPSTALVPVAQQCDISECHKEYKGAGYGTWYFIVKGSGVVYTCPYCYQTEVRPTSYRADVRSEDNQFMETGTRCWFASKWHKLAWDVIYERGLRNLDLVDTMSRINRDKQYEPCRRGEKIHKRWLTVDPDRVATKWKAPTNFYLCEKDVAKLDALFPRLKKCWIKDEHRRRECCDLATDNSRFVKFTRMLSKADAKSLRKDKRADLADFMTYANIAYKTPECPQNEMIKNAKWHLMNRLPDFTVCEECYLDKVDPECGRSRLADQISSDPQRIRLEYRYGHGCQLSSRSAVDAFDQAIDSDDPDILRKHVNANVAWQRRNKEREEQLRDQQLNLQRQQAQQGHAGGTAFQMGTIKEELGNVGKQRKTYE